MKLVISNFQFLALEGGQNSPLMHVPLSLKMSCADPETFVWRAGYYRPYSGFAIEMAFRWPADCGPTLNADFVALQVLVGSEPVLLRNPIVL